MSTSILSAAPSLATAIGSVQLDSPLLNASGAFWPETSSQLFALKSCMGGVVSKTLTQHAQAGNAQQRTVELPSVGMLNSIGLQGKGLAHFLNVDLPALVSHEVPVVVSLSAGTAEAFVAMVEACQPHAAYITALELNLSCPNVKAGGADAGSSPEWVANVVRQVKANTHLPCWAKLTPNVTSMLPLAEAALNAGADGLVAINTVLGSHVDVRRKTLSLSRTFGGYSGPGLKPIALYQCLKLAQAFPNVPLVGVGGISTLDDVLEFLMVGCSAVQVGTASFKEPLLFPKLKQGLLAYLQQEGLSSIKPLIACALP
jgi:dihydroorotate dehydrogenase (NAD+) catalytic subunit